MNIIYNNCTVVQCLLTRFEFNILEYFINSPVKNASCDSDTSDFDIVDYEPQDGMVIEGDTFL